MNYSRTNHNFSESLIIREDKGSKRCSPFHANRGIAFLEASSLILQSMESASHLSETHPSHGPQDHSFR